MSRLAVGGTLDGAHSPNQREGSVNIVGIKKLVKAQETKAECLQSHGGRRGYLDANEGGPVREHVFFRSRPSIF